MNAQDLWSGYDYAYCRYGVRKGERYAERGVERVKIVRVTKRRLYGNERLSSFAEVVFCDEETGEVLNGAIPKEVSTRDIFLRWDDYEGERAKRRAERMREEEERQRRYNEAQERNNKLMKLINKAGLPQPTSLNNAYVTFDRDALEEALLDE